MPRRELMSWEGEPNYRWTKFYKGVRYRVTCEMKSGLRLNIPLHGKPKLVKMIGSSQFGQSIGVI